MANITLDNTQHATPEEMNRNAVLSKLGLFILLALLILVGYAQSQNMFQFPYYQDVEGTNLSNAWSLANGGDLSPYTYAYEEPPAGSFIIGAWTQITGGIDTFGFTLNSGRVLMLALHVVTVALIYGITKKVTRSDLAAVVATLIFAFSPLATSLQRMVLLDNIMITSMLMSFYLILGDNRSVIHYLASAVFFGAAALIKLDAVFFLPGMMFTARLRAHQHHKRFVTSLWMIITLLLISFYPLYAHMRQEFLPYWLSGNGYEHVSLLEQLAQRGPDNGVFLNIGSGLAESFTVWTELANGAADPVIIYGGAIAFLFLFVLAIDNRELRPIVGMMISYAVFLLLGGQIFSSHIVSMLPFLAIAIGAVAAAISAVVTGMFSNQFVKFALTMLVLAVILYPFWIFYSERTAVYTTNQIEGQIAAVNWVQRNVASDEVVVTDNFAFLELRQSMPNAHHYWKVAIDPEVRDTLLEQDICNIDYLVVTPQVTADMQTYYDETWLLREAMDKSEPLITYPNNGWDVTIRQVSKQGCINTPNSDTPDLASF